VPDPRGSGGAGKKGGEPETSKPARRVPRMIKTLNKNLFPLKGRGLMTIQTASEYMAEASRLVSNPNATSNDLGRAKVLTSLAELASAGDLDTDSRFKDFATQRYAGDHTKSVAQLFNESQSRVIRGKMDAATLEFFGGKRSSPFTGEAVISTTGGRIQERPTGLRMNGRPLGAITELQDFGFGIDTRTYSGLSTSTSGDAGGYAIPIGFIAQVFAAVKLTDQILGAADWDTAATATGNPVNIPSLTDTSTSAVTYAEAAAQVFANPSYSQIKSDGTACPEATGWTSQVVLASKQLAMDALPTLVNTLGDAFRVRMARGFGGSVVTTLLADCDVGATTAAAGAVTQTDLLNLIKSVDAGYASAPSAALAMNWNSLIAILSTVNASATAGDAMFHLKRDAQGRFLLFGIPTLISNSLPDISASNKSVLFGDWSKLLIRNVPGQFVVRRYDELFAAKFQNGYEMLARLDGAVVHAGGSSDQPIKILQMHS
jgi:HK97 family phage major capsid protein